MDVCDFCCEWANSHRDADPEDIRYDYPDMMKVVLMEKFNMSEEVAKNFIQTACVGNWKHMHETEEEKGFDARYYVMELADDVWYCSDRWSWDRVIRNQWRYQRILERIGWNAL